MLRLHVNPQPCSQPPQTCSRLTASALLQTRLRNSSSCPHLHSGMSTVSWLPALKRPTIGAPARPRTASLALVVSFKRWFAIGVHQAAIGARCFTGSGLLPLQCAQQMAWQLHAAAAAERVRVSGSCARGSASPAAPPSRGPCYDFKRAAISQLPPEERRRALRQRRSLQAGGQRAAGAGAKVGAV